MRRTLFWSSTAAAALVLATVAGAATAKFSGNVCGLLKASQLATVHVTTKCNPHKRVTNSQGTVYDAVWGVDKALGTPRLNVGIFKPANALYLQILQRRPGNVKVGSWAREEPLSNGKTAANIMFIADGYVMTINLATKPSNPLKSIAPFTALARAVAAKL